MKNYIVRHESCGKCAKDLPVWQFAPYNDDGFIRARRNDSQVVLCPSCWNSLVNREIVFTEDGWKWDSEDAPIYHSMLDARYILRDAQKTVHGSNEWHSLSNAINYLDAQIDNLRDSLGIPLEKWTY